MPKSPPIDFGEIRRLAITAVFSDDLLFEKVVLKGGNALSLAHHLSTRTSLDLDFSIEGDFEDIDEIRGRLRRALENRFSSVGLVAFDFKLEPKPRTVPEGQDPRWGGYMASFKVSEKRKYDELLGDPDALRRDSLVVGPAQQRVFNIDLSKYEYVAGKVQLELDDYVIYVYSPRMIAIEKLRAICQQMPDYALRRYPTARARDFYDIHLIAATLGMDFSSPGNLELTRQIFAAKAVPLEFLGLIKDQREFHRPDWDSVKASSREKVEDFDYYFDFVAKRVESMKALWEE
ncbi:MAG: nucleotidyl transferase AbiEii/AbiGii toxin family protein [Terracidiphilus sp.]|jgi:hypothetical protein